MATGVAATIIKTIKIVVHEMRNTNIYLQQTTTNAYIYNICYICFHLQLSMQQQQRQQPCVVCANCCALALPKYLFICQQQQLPHCKSNKKKRKKQKPNKKRHKKWQILKSFYCNVGLAVSELNKMCCMQCGTAVESLLQMSANG